MTDRSLLEALDSAEAAPAEAKGPVEGWRWADALRALHRHGLAYEEQSEGVRSALAAAARHLGAESLDAAWEALASDRPATRREAVARHRPIIEAAIRKAR